MAGILNVGNRDPALGSKCTGQTDHFLCYLREASLSLRAVFSLAAPGAPAGWGGFSKPLDVSGSFPFSHSNPDYGAKINARADNHLIGAFLTLAIPLVSDVFPESPQR